MQLLGLQPIPITGVLQQTHIPCQAPCMSQRMFKTCLIVRHHKRHTCQVRVFLREPTTRSPASKHGTYVPASSQLRKAQTASNR